MTTMLSQIDVLNIYPSSQAGTIQELALGLFDLLTLSGYSLSQDEIETLILAECRYYAGWAAFQAQEKAKVALDSSLTIECFEWSILEQVIRAHCNVVEAQRIEALKSLGGAEFGLSASEASQLYLEERAKLPQLACIEPPFSLELD